MGVGFKPVQQADCSFIIQGPVKKHNGKDITQELVSDLRMKYPDSEIILSTWRSCTEISNATKVVYSEDPGTIKKVKSTFFQNLNRQIVSTKNGLLASTKKYSFKIRSDFYFVDKADVFDVINNLLVNSIKSPSFFDMPVVLSFQTPSIDIYSLPDWFNFGLTNDLLKIWTIPLAKTDDEFSIGGYQLSPEQYVFLNMLKIDKLKYDNIFTLFNVLHRHDFNFLKGELIYVSRFNLGYESYTHPIKFSRYDEKISRCININNYCFMTRLYFLLKIIKRNLKI